MGPSRSQPAWPGVILGSDGSREMLAADTRSGPAPVVLIDISAEGWRDAVPQAGDVPELIERVEAGTFKFTW